MPSISFTLSLRGSLLNSVVGPESLFYAGEVGQFSEVDPMYLFQDTVGTQPVTAPGQSVALWLDKSKGLALGPEWVTNGDFSTDTAWTKGAGWTISGGAASFSNVSGSTLSQTGFSLPAGSTFEIRFNLTQVSGSGLIIQFSGGGGADQSSTVSGSGSKRLLLTASINRTTFAFSALGGSVFSVDDVSIKLLPGNHDTQPTVGSRPIYGKHPANGYRNMLASSEDFSAAVWVKSTTTVDTDAAVAPDGTLTADRITATGTNEVRSDIVNFTGSNATLSCYFKIGTQGTSQSTLQIRNQTTGTNIVAARLNLSTGAITYLAGSTGAVAEQLQNGWWRFSISAVFTAGNTLRAAVGNAGYSATIGDNSLIWGAQLETGSTATTYQRAGASSGVAWPAPPSYDITEAGQPDLHYLHYNGVSSFTVSPTITPATDKVQVFFGVRKLSDPASTAILAELSASTINAGTFGVQSSRNVAGKPYAMESGGSLPYSGLAQSSAYTAPSSNVIAGYADISGDMSTIRIDGAQQGQSTADQGTGNYNANVIYTGRRGGITNPYNGLVYCKIIRFGANLTIDQIASTERWTAQRTGVAIT